MVDPIAPTLDVLGIPNSLQCLHTFMGTMPGNRMILWSFGTGWGLQKLDELHMVFCRRRWSWSASFSDIIHLALSEPQVAKFEACSSLKKSLWHYGIGVQSTGKLGTFAEWENLCDCMCIYNYMNYICNYIYWYTRENQPKMNIRRFTGTPACVEGYMNQADGVVCKDGVVWMLNDFLEQLDWCLNMFETSLVNILQGRWYVWIYFGWWFGIFFRGVETTNQYWFIGRKNDSQFMRETWVPCQAIGAKSANEASLLSFIFSKFQHFRLPHLHVSFIRTCLLVIPSVL